MTLEITETPQASFNLRRITRHPLAMEYHRLYALVAIVNLVLAVLWWQDGSLLQNGVANLELLANMALINFSLGILIRQQRLVNFLFWLATRIPTSWPLWIRWRAAKVFHFGGLHSGGNTAGSLWFTLLLAGMAYNRWQGQSLPSDLTLGLTGVMLALIALIVTCALPSMRARYHNLFEKTHRFAGWTLLAFFWAQTLSLIHDQGQPVLQQPSIWALAVITLSVVSPWLTLKRVKIEVVKPSNHAVTARFDYGDTPFPGSSNAISHTPFGEYHAFANAPKPGESGYRLVISRAGDWTGRFIDNPPSHVWVKGITTSGVARIEVLFKKVVYVGTGSGIGPILPHLFAGEVPNRLIWSTRSPRKTYGALVDEVEASTENPLIWDTDLRGKPDLAALALQAVQETGAEAVIVIANQKVTRQVVYAMECQGIPAYGAIWDS
ncbi:hypothetical protein MUU53_06445 [Rhizobium lemnae]|uniref:Ferredoxin reductase family protein n=1 Tax=Rhizobium lemnae TaxID=1214924 RepID=A0ABV8E497_9HYPH|nr:hypothetical protein [Rhizobium lemnae]MCJ8507552.1 hypothetical protein [Rhizobium lemnae]